MDANILIEKCRKVDIQVTPLSTLGYRPLAPETVQTYQPGTPCPNAMLTMLARLTNNLWYILWGQLIFYYVGKWCYPVI
jgi:hypothetical protein